MKQSTDTMKNQTTRTKPTTKKVTEILDGVEVSFNGTFEFKIPTAMNAKKFETWKKRNKAKLTILVAEFNTIIGSRTKGVLTRLKKELKTFKQPDHRTDERYFRNAAINFGRKVQLTFLVDYFTNLQTTSSHA